MTRYNTYRGRRHHVSRDRRPRVSLPLLYGSYDTTFMFERYVELDERWLFDLAKDPEGRKPTVTWQSYNRSGVLYESYDEMFISLLPRKVENPELKRILRDYFRIRSQKKKVAKSITVYQDAAERFGD